MLTITPDALTIIRRVTTHPSMQPEGGLRIASRANTSAPLEVRAVSGPGEHDVVVDRSGARLYVGSDVTGRIDDGELDAVTDDGGRVQFVLRPAA